MQLAQARPLSSNTITPITDIGSLADLLVSKLDPEALISVLRAARALADSRSEDHLSDAETHSSRGGPTYDPGAVFLLELMQSLTLRASEAIEELWYVILIFGSCHC